VAHSPFGTSAGEADCDCRRATGDGHSARFTGILGPWNTGPPQTMATASIRLNNDLPLTEGQPVGRGADSTSHNLGAVKGSSRPIIGPLRPTKRRLGPSATDRRIGATCPGRYASRSSAGRPKRYSISALTSLPIRSGDEPSGPSITQQGGGEQPTRERPAAAPGPDRMARPGRLHLSLGFHQRVAFTWPDEYTGCSVQ